MQPWIYYFCYGSNMLTKRMHVNNKSATKFSNGILREYKLTFSGNSVTWDGSTANIVPDSNSIVRGVIYKLDQADIVSLDKQEFGYNAIEVEVDLDLPPSEPQQTVICRTYVQKADYASAGNGIPSKLYKDVIIKGAEEHGLCQHYIENVIKAFPDNGKINCGPPGFVL